MEKNPPFALKAYFSLGRQFDKKKETRLHMDQVLLSVSA